MNFEIRDCWCYFTPSKSLKQVALIAALCFPGVDKEVDLSSGDALALYPCIYSLDGFGCKIAI
jgi:hypothetical protein